MDDDGPIKDVHDLCVQTLVEGGWDLAETNKVVFPEEVPGP